MSSAYSRNTELRNVESNDLYKLAVILEEDNYWQQLMEIIPKEINNQAFAKTSSDLEKFSLQSAAYERKYNNDHIRLIQSAILRPGESRLFSQILFDEWGSSGRQHERPTLGVLLHLLVQSKLYRAADFVAELLNEAKPTRPTNGPAAAYEFEIDVVFNDIQDVVNDSRYYPTSADLEENVNNDNNSLMNINKDYYTKYHEAIDKKLPVINENNSEDATTPPIPPPRLHKSARLLKLQQQQQLEQMHQVHQTAISSSSSSAGYSNTNNMTPKCIEQQLSSSSNNENLLMSTTSSTNNIPKLSALMNSTNSENATTNYSIVSDNSYPKLSLLENSSESRNSQPYVEDLEYSSIIGTKPRADLNSIPKVIFNKPLNIDNIKEEQLQHDNDNKELHNLPAISELNLNGEQDDDGDAINSSNNLQNVPSVALNFIPTNDKNNTSDDDLNIPLMVACIYNSDDINAAPPHLEAIKEEYNDIKHEHDEQEHDLEVEFYDDDDENSIPNLSFLDNRSSNNESSLTSITNTSGDNSFEQSVNDCSSTSTDNVPFLSVLNQ